MQVVVDGVEAEICPLPFAKEAVGQIVSLEHVRAVSQEQLDVLAIVATLGTGTRRQVERLRGEDCESLLRRLTQRRLVEPVADEGRPGAPNVYRLTTRGVAVCGHSSLEGLQAELLGAMEKEADRIAKRSWRCTWSRRWNRSSTATCRGTNQGDRHCRRWRSAATDAGSETGSSTWTSKPSPARFRGLAPAGERVHALRIRCLDGTDVADHGPAGRGARYPPSLPVCSRA